MNKDMTPGKSGEAWTPIVVGNADSWVNGRAGQAHESKAVREPDLDDPVVASEPERRLGPARGFILAVVAGLFIWFVVLSILAKLI